MATEAAPEAGPPTPIPPCSEAAFAVLKQRWAGRELQIHALLTQLDTPTQAARTLLVYGGPATGKTAVVRCASAARCAPISDRFPAPMSQVS